MNSVSGHLPTLAIVVPCYNEEEVLPETAKRLEALLDQLVKGGQIAAGSYVCLVDDGSTDKTWALISGLHAASAIFTGIRLSRNRGHQAALITGLLAVHGDVVISIDADLQDDLGAIKPMLEAAANKSDIVYGVRRTRSTDTVIKRYTARLFYRVLSLLGVDIVYDHADFRLLTRKALNALKEYDEVNLFLRALVPQLGFQTSIVTYDRAARFAGSSKYPTLKMLSLAFEGITSFSIAPLRLVTLLGLLVSACAIVLSLWAVYATVVLEATIPGWASTVVPIYLICGVQLLCVGIIGEYVGKIYLETKRRPRAHVAETLMPLSSNLELPVQLK